MRLRTKLLLTVGVASFFLVGCFRESTNPAETRVEQFLKCYYSYNKDGRYDNYLVSLEETLDQLQGNTENTKKPAIYTDEALDAVVDQYYEELAGLTEETMLNRLRSNQWPLVEEKLYAQAGWTCEVAQVSLEQKTENFTYSYTLELTVYDEEQEKQTQIITGDIGCMLENGEYLVNYFHERTCTPTMETLLE